MTSSSPHHFRTLVGTYFSTLMFVGVLFFVPLLALPAAPGEIPHALPFIAVGAITTGSGWLVRRWLMPDEHADLTVPDGMSLVLLAWLTAIFASTIPLVAVEGLTFWQALFEATSGWTTCGLTVIDVESAPRIILLFRSVMQHVGGLGFVLLTVLALITPSDLSILVAAGKEDQLSGSAWRSAQIISGIYAAYTVLGTVGFWLAGMGWFDAVNHAMAGISTGGFSTKAASIGHFDSVAVEGVAIALMLLGALNFSTVYVLLNGRVKYFVQNAEVRTSFVVLPVGIVLLLVSTTFGVYASLGEAFRRAVFASVSALTTTGFAATGYGDWSRAGWLILILMMSMGGGSGSTAGGIKLNRVYALYLRLRHELEEVMRGKTDPEEPSPHVPEPEVREGEKNSRVTGETASEVGSLLFLYVAALFIGVFVFLLYGFPMDASIFEAASALGTVGLSAGVTAADSPPALLIVQSILMLLGRLEFFVIFIGLAHSVRYVFRRVP